MASFVEAAVELDETFGGAGRFVARTMLRGILGNISWSLDAPRYSMKEVVRAAIAGDTSVAIGPRSVRDRPAPFIDAC